MATPAELALVDTNVLRADFVRIAELEVLTP